jgi:hypothetical protein
MKMKDNAVSHDQATAGSLNESQRRHLLTSFEHIDELLSEIEGILNAPTSKSPFPRFRIDVTPVQSKVIQDTIARMRTRMLRLLGSQGLGPRTPLVGAIHAIQVSLTFVGITLAEIGPKYMKGYGEVPESMIADLNGMITELNTLVDQLVTYLAQSPGNQT